MIRYKPFIIGFLIVSLMGLEYLSSSTHAKEVVPTSKKVYESTIKPFFKEHCYRCHGQEKQKADYALHDIDYRIASGKDLERWEKALELISLGDMPPQKKSIKQPSKALKKKVTHWIEKELQKIGRGPNKSSLAMPSQGNRVDHEELFSGEHKGPAFSPMRLWRKSPKIYQKLKYGTQPFMGIGGKGFQDYATLIADEAPINAMLRNSYLLAEKLMKNDDRRNPLQHFAKYKGKELPVEEEKKLLDSVFRLIFMRGVSKEDNKYIEKLYQKNKSHGGWEGGLESLIVGMLLSPEFVFRMEVGLGKKLEDGRRMLSPKELAFALSFALQDEPNTDLLQLADTGKLSTKKDVAREVRKILYQPFTKKGFGYGMVHHVYKPDGYANPRLIRFFQEFFGYLPALEVFKEKKRFQAHYARNLVKDADFLILMILEKDKEVIKELLTTNVYFSKDFTEQDVQRYANPNTKNKQAQYIVKRHPHVVEIAKRGKLPAFVSLGGNGQKGPMTVSPSYLPEDELKKLERVPGGDLILPKEQRAGILTHPAWLVAHSYNTDNNLVERGKWIREHLLADLIPEVPLGVEAKVPDIPEKTLREKYEIVQKEECWRCHKKMNPLAYALEAYDDFGRYRTEIVVGDIEGYEEKLYEYNEQKRNYQLKLHALKARTPEAISQDIKRLKKQIANKPKPDDEKLKGSEKNYQEALKRYEKQSKKWHKQIDQLKNYSHENRLANIKDIEKLLGELVAPIPTTKPVDASGVLDGTGDPKLDGPYKTPRELMEKLAASRKVKQSIIRHAFRYWMGRNETLSDSPTLIAAEKAYDESGGSFKEVIISLLTSDSFLYRK